MINPTTLISTTREGFARVGLCCAHQTEMVNEDGDIEPVIVMSPVAYGNGIAIRHTLIRDDVTPENLVYSIWQAARAEGLV